MFKFSRIPSFVGAAMLCLATLGLSMSALPAQAAPTLKPIPGLEGPSTLKPGTIKPIPGLGPTLKPGVLKPIPGLHAPGVKKPKGTLDISFCLTNKQIRKGLRNAGFEDIEFVKELKQNRVRVHALYEDDNWVYSMRIDRCDGEVDQIKPLYEADEYDFDIEF